jgi:hypothetical protein
MAASELHENIARCLRTDAEREFWVGSTPAEQDRYVAILKADGLGEAVKEVKKAIAAEAKAMP